MDMELNEFVAKFAEQFAETEFEMIKSDTVFRDLEEWSSILALSIIAMVDEEYNVSIKGVDIKSSNTIEDLFNIVRDRI